MGRHRFLKCANESPSTVGGRTIPVRIIGLDAVFSRSLSSFQKINGFQFPPRSPCTSNRADGTAQKNRMVVLSGRLSWFVWRNSQPYLLQFHGMESRRWYAHVSDKVPSD